MSTINGREYDFSDVQIMTPAGVLDCEANISYSDEAPLEETYDAKGKVRGRIKKNYKASGSIELPRAEADQLIAALGSNFMRTPFTIVVSYGNDGGQTSVDTLVDCVITKNDAGGQQENKVTKKFDLSIKKIIWNGLEPIS